jgi:hypothetical protein
MLIIAAQRRYQEVALLRPRSQRAERSSWFRPQVVHQPVGMEAATALSPEVDYLLSPNDSSWFPEDFWTGSMANGRRAVLAPSLSSMSMDLSSDCRRVVRICWLRTYGPLLNLGCL